MELLFWLSARKEGSWRQFRAAVEELHAADTNSDECNCRCYRQFSVFSSEKEVFLAINGPEGQLKKAWEHILTVV